MVTSDSVFLCEERTEAEETVEHRAAEPDGITSVAEIMGACHVAPCRVYSVRYELRKKKKLSIDHGFYEYRLVTR